MTDSPSAHLSGTDMRISTTAPRSTPAYNAALGLLVRVNDEHHISQGVESLWRSYRWHGLVDFQDLILRDLHDRAPANYRNPVGAVRLDMVMKPELTDEEVLENAVAYLDDKACCEICEHTRPPSFEEAYQRSVLYARTVRDHYLSWQKALDAHARNAPQEAWGILARTPGIRDLRDDGKHQRWATCLLALCRLSILPDHPGHPDDGTYLDTLVYKLHARPSPVTSRSEGSGHST